MSATSITSDPVLTDPQRGRGQGDGSASDGAGRAVLDGAIWLDEFLAESDPVRATAILLDRPGQRRRQRSRRELALLITRTIAEIDDLLSAQVNAILHHPRFQKLEAGWRGLRYLVEQSDSVENMQLRVMSVTWRELSRDLDLAIEFDQSVFFRKIYSDEFGTAGGTPYTVLIGDYEIRHKLGANHQVDDVAALMAISQVSACAFAPFIAGAHPSMFDMDGFDQMERAPNFPRMFEHLDYMKWRTLRHTEDARFVCLTLPRVLMRLPYENDGSRNDGFVFQEDVSGPDRSKYLWGNAAWALGAVIIRAFHSSRWFADIRGVQRGKLEGGVVTGLASHSFNTDAPNVAVKCSVDVMLTDQQEKELSDLGFIPLCHCHDTEFAVFYANQSVQKPRVYDDVLATTNSRMSAMLQYMLCSARFAHYIKVIARDKIGSFVDPRGFQTFLHNWVFKYVAPNADVTAEQKAKYPLHSAKVTVREHPGRPGSYLTDLHLWPHFQLDDLTASIKLVTEFSAGTGGG